MNCMVCGREINGEDPVYCHKREMFIAVCSEHRMDCTDCDSCTMLVSDGTDKIFIRQENKR